MNGGNEIIADNRAVIDGFTIDSLTHPQINNNGDIIFGTKLDGLPAGRDFAYVSADRVVLKAGGLIEDLTVDYISGGFLTDNGEIVAALWGIPTNGESIAFIGTQDRILFRAGDFVEDIQVQLIGGTFRRNAAGQLSFLGGVFAPGTHGYTDDVRGMLFALNTVVISEGDILDGKVVQVLWPAFDMNEHGDLAFRVRFEDRSEAVVLATSNNPEPNSFLLAVLGVCTLLARPQRRSRNRKGPQ
ncbi:MAG: hypothetical protein IID44_30115 [Planctomycetes bacterium]|nr:hypothetical protein [Planctomycetota bacterium]